MSSSVVAAGESGGKNNKKDQLYNRCLEESEAIKSGYAFQQSDLENMNIAADTSELMTIIQQLQDQHLFALHQLEGGMCWKLRTKEQAQTLKRMNGEERLVYQLIESVNTQGIWSKTIKAKLNLTQTNMTKIMKMLETKNIVKSFMSIKHQARKMYILSHLEPSEDVRGGPWHEKESGDFDTGLIETLADFVVDWVREQSWSEAAGPSKADIKQKRNAFQNQGKQREGVDGQYATKRLKMEHGAQVPDIEGSPSYFAALTKVKPYYNKHGRPLVPRPPGYRGYPTPTQILEAITTSNIVKGIALREVDISQLLDSLVWDGKLERMGINTFRTVRGARSAQVPDEPTNGLSQAPCGMCPVFSLCEEGGPVNAGNCVYFAEWLKL